MLIGRRGAIANNIVEPAPTYVNILSHHILIARRSAITPKEGLTRATNNAAPETENDQIASPVKSIDPIVVVKPFAFKNKYENHKGSTATVTLVSNEDLAQSKYA